MRIIVLLLFLKVSFNALPLHSETIPATDLLRWEFTPENGKIVIDEMLRQHDLAILRVNQVSEKEQLIPSGKAVIRAAVDVGMLLKQRYFVLLDGREKSDGYYITLFYSQDPELDPSTRYPDYFSEEARQYWRQHGYHAIPAILKQLNNDNKAAMNEET